MREDDTAAELATDYEKLLLPAERVFLPSDPNVRERLGLDTSDSDLG